jgi:hypothetical protein
MKPRNPRKLDRVIPSAIPEKDRLKGEELAKKRKAIALDVQTYLSNGGSIRKVPIGESAYVNGDPFGKRKE